MRAINELPRMIAHTPIQKRAMTNHGVLNEAYAYAKPSSFSRGMRIDPPPSTKTAIRCMLEIFARRCAGLSATSRAFLRAKGAPGTTLCAPPVTCATSTAIMMPSTKSVLRSPENKALIPCPHQPVFKPTCAVLNCWWKSKLSPCS